MIGSLESDMPTVAALSAADVRHQTVLVHCTRLCSLLKLLLLLLRCRCSFLWVSSSSLVAAFGLA
jgi:hypothetical protein